MKWSDRVRRALREPQIAAGIAQIVAGAMKDHIDESQGRGASGASVPHQPLKNLTSEVWTFKKPKGAKVVATRKVGTRTEYRIRVDGYRNGGHPLRDTGQMYREMNAGGVATSAGMRITLRGPRHALYQDRGFSTKRTNFIPLTLAAKRGHGTGNDPRAEGFAEGRDYLLARRGVTVPSRPFLLPTRKEMTEIGKSIFLGLRSILKRT